MRLQVFLSHNGVCSRRNAMELIQSGRVTVNGRQEREPSADVDGTEAIKVDGKRVEVQTYTYIMLHKPPGVTTTKEDPFAKKTVMDILPKELHFLSPVGRLDKDSEGLLLLTNDGNWAHGLMHPKFHLEKTYIVKVKGKVDQKNIRKLQEGVVIDNEKTAPCRIAQVRYNDADTELQITIHEGKKRQIRRMFWSMGHKVIFLKRISIGPLSLNNLKIGEYRTLQRQEIDALKKV